MTEMMKKPDPEVIRAALRSGSTQALTRDILRYIRVSLYFKYPVYILRALITRQPSVMHTQRPHGQNCVRLIS